MLDSLPEWPLFGFDDDARPALRQAAEAGEPLALATIVDLDGGGPRPVGTQMTITRRAVSGFLSGGCLEGDVAAHAASVLEDGTPRRLVYGANELSIQRFETNVATLVEPSLRCRSGPHLNERGTDDAA